VHLGQHSSGRGPTLLFVHGIGCTHRFWEDAVPRLESDFSCLVVDVPGFGESPALGGEPSVAGLAAELDTWLADTGTERVVVVGHSLGGMIAQELALADPERVRGVVLCNTIPGTTEHIDEINRGLAAMAEQQGALALAEAMLPAMVGPDELENTARAKDRFLTDFGGASPASLAAAFLAVTRFDARPRLPQLRERTLPALVVAGEHEGNEADQRELAELSGAQFELVAGTGHLSPAETPTAFLGLLAPFLAAHRQGDDWQ
jgi:3-oxoadipate enol-lactonase